MLLVPSLWLVFVGSFTYRFCFHGYGLLTVSPVASVSTIMVSVCWQLHLSLLFPRLWFIDRFTSRFCFNDYGLLAVSSGSIVMVSVCWQFHQSLLFPWLVFVGSFISRFCFHGYGLLTVSPVASVSTVMICWQFHQLFLVPLLWLVFVGSFTSRSCFLNVRQNVGNCSAVRYLFDVRKTRAINDLMPMIGARFFTQLDHVQLRADCLLDQLSKVSQLLLTVSLSDVNEGSFW